MNPDEIASVNDDPKDWDAEERSQEDAANADNSEVPMELLRNTNSTNMNTCEKMSAKEMNMNLVLEQLLLALKDLKEYMTKTQIQMATVNEIIGLIK